MFDEIEIDFQGIWKIAVWIVLLLKSGTIFI